MRTAAPVALLAILACDAAAGEQQAWEFVYVSRSTNLEAVKGYGSLHREGAHLSGSLTDTTTGEYEIAVTLNGSEAVAVFGATESDDGGTRMRGTFRQSEIPALGGTHCWQTIQLSDGFNAITLARNAPVCEP